MCISSLRPSDARRWAVSTPVSRLGRTLERKSRSCAVASSLRTCRDVLIAVLLSDTCAASHHLVARKAGASVMRKALIIASVSFASCFSCTALATEITDVIWEPSEHFIWVKMDSWPAVWPGWTMYVDGTEMPMQGAAGDPWVAPDGPVDQATGVIIGTLPWLTGLDDVDFPCCGTLQFSIPGEGLTNVYDFDLPVYGCVTASTKECPSDWTIHEGDLVIDGTTTYVIEDQDFFQKGHIYINNSATLIVRRSNLMIARGYVPTVHVYIFVDDDATLIIESSSVFSPPEGGTGAGLICVINEGDVLMTDSDTEIHYLNMSGTAEFTMTNSSMVNVIGGLLQVMGGSTTVTDSTLGALGLNVAAGKHLDVTGLHSGVYFESWDVHDMIPDADYNLVLVRTSILEDDFTGELEHGPYERGWIFFVDRDAHVDIADSELRKIFFRLNTDTTEFHDLRVGVPTSLTFRDIVLTDVIVTGQWPFEIGTGCDVTFRNSEYLFLQPSQWSTVRVLNSHIVEFIPRNFAGDMIFENAVWTTAGELVAGADYHSSTNQFAMEGSLRMGPELRTNLVFYGAVVTRQLRVIATDVMGEPVSGVVIEIDDRWLRDNIATYVTDEMGEALLSVRYHTLNYRQEVPGSIEPDDPSPETPLVLEVWQSGALIDRRALEFFEETPIRIEGLSASTPAVFRVTQAGSIGADGTVHGAAFGVGGADIAEWVWVSGQVCPGDVLELDPVNPQHYRLSTESCSELVAGVVSSIPGVVLGRAESDQPQALLAIAGIVPVNVTDEGGAIQPGDLLVASYTPGYAMRWTGPGTCPCSLVGKALEPMTEEAGMIHVLLTAH